MSLASSAQAQDLMGFDRASFGSVVLSRTLAVGTGIQLELSVGSYQNEPMSNYKDCGQGPQDTGRRAAGWFRESQDLGDVRWAATTR